jgi:NitT/TauT family transport system substrate-binding protein
VDGEDTIQAGDSKNLEHGLLGEGAPNARFIGIEGPTGVYGNENNVRLRFNPEFMQMAEDGEL